MRFAYILSAITAFLLLFSTCVRAQDLMVGQIWKYKARPHESQSTITIVQLDNYVVHISISGLKVKDPDADDGLAESIRHLPMEINAFNNSKTKLVGFTEKLPEFEEGLADWIKARNRGEAKPISIPVKDVIEQVEIMINQ
ncbi:MAG: hypothetical protein D6B28_04710 [Gammaproteobacteria bacterium]|nr:MAG: hypothetical protein D6B28_04710 [Gammaproteobacteria bacterium]